MTFEKHSVLVLKTQRSELADDIPEFVEFQKRFNVYIYQVTTKEELIAKLENEYKQISALWSSGPSLWKLGGVTPFIDHLPPSLKVLVYPWVGYLEDDAEKLRAKNITYCNVGDVSANDVADIALHLTLSAYRFTSYFEHEVRKDLSIIPARSFLGSEKFNPKTLEPLLPPPNANIAKKMSIGGKKLESPFGKIAGIVGLGSIGAAIGKRLSAIGMEIRYTKRTPLSKEDESKLGYKAKFYPSFEELIPEVDLIVFAVPGSTSTKHLINSETIKLVKPGVRLVNIGRGSVINEDVMFEALDNGIITSVGLDVFEGEPKIDPRYQNRWDVTITPHIGNLTTDNTVESNKRCIRNIVNVLIENGPGISPVN